MSAAEESVKTGDAVRGSNKSIWDKILGVLSSVRFGVILLCILTFLSIVGMVVIQQNVEGFDAYYASKTPAERYVYGLLGLFDVYYTWYYNGLLGLLSLNIVLASIDRFPAAWNYIRHPKLNATRGFLSRQQVSESLEVAGPQDETSEAIENALRANGFSAATTSNETTTYGTDENGLKDFSRVEKRSSLVVFGERGKWNRLGAYIVHVFLLMLFLGHFVAHETGFDADIRLTPDSNTGVQQDFGVAKSTNAIEMIEINLDQRRRYDVQLPFTITCTEIEQKLIDPNGSIDISNTLDWRTQIKIEDPQYGVTIADVSLNKPYHYRGYRFFQASAITMGSASEMTLELRPENGGDPIRVPIKRNGTANLADGTLIEYSTFTPDFVMKGGQPSTKSGDYVNPAVILDVTPAGGEKTKVYAFANKLPDNAPIAAPKAGYRWQMVEYRKSPVAHVLSVKYDPYSGAFIAWYVGGIGLMGALVYVFFFSHRRIWALIEDSGSGTTNVLIGGDTNRNHMAFQDKFSKFLATFEGLTGAKRISPSAEE